MLHNDDQTGRKTNKKKNNQAIVFYTNIQNKHTNQTKKGVYSLLHEVIHFRVDSLDDGHQVVQDVFGVVHSGVHKVPVM